MGVISRTVGEYLSMLKGLLPQGAAWPRHDGTKLEILLKAWADEFARVDQRAADLVREADPRTTVEMLTDWERVAGLPDACTGELEGLTNRREALVSKLGNLGGQSRQFFIDLAASLGFTVTITEEDSYAPFTAGSVAGDALTNDPWQYIWTVHAPESSVVNFAAGSAAGDALAEWGNNELECVISRAKPAHTHVQFSYS